jgi:hypothetical protein
MRQKIYRAIERTDSVSTASAQHTERERETKKETGAKTKKEQKIPTIYWAGF